MNFFSARRKMEQEYIAWITENPEIKDCTFTVISFLEMKGYLRDLRSVGTPASNRRHINEMPNRKLAEMLINSSERPDYDYDYEENMYQCGTIDVFHTSDGSEFTDWDEALNHESWWLDQKYKPQTVKAYRVENQVEQHGIWRDFDGTINPVFKHLSQGKCKDMPMEDSDFYRADGFQWFSATDTPEKLKAWFSALDVIEMERMGYKVYEFEISEYRVVSEYEIVFTRECVVSQREIPADEIWGAEFAQLRKAGESDG